MSKRYLGVIPGAGAVIVFLATTCRSIWIGDSGEFALAAKTLGICHPPGYPLFTMMGRIFAAALPFLRPILAVNLLNILIAAAAVSTIYYILRRSLTAWSSIFLSLIWAFTPLFWDETSGVEIYILNLLFLALIFLILESGIRRKWILAIYLFGLSLTNHPSALSIFPVIVFFFIKDEEYRNWRIFPLYLFLIFIAATVYLYLPIRSSFNPISNWGNPSSFKALIDHMTLSQYSGWISYSFGNLAMSIRLFYLSLMNSWGLIGLLTTVLGIIIGMRINLARTVSALLILITSAILASSHRALNFEPFYIPAVFACLLLSGNLFDYLERRLDSRLLRFIPGAVLAVGSLMVLIHNYGVMDKSGYTLAEDYAKNMLDTAESGILFTAGDINSFPSLYLRYAEGYSPDVTVYDRSVRHGALVDHAREISGIDIAGYYDARETLIRKEIGSKFLAKIHYVYEPDWRKLTEPIFSYGLLYSVNQRPPGRPTIPEYPVDYRTADVLSRQLLINLDLCRGEQLINEMPADTAAGMEAYERAIGRLVDERQAVVLNNVGIYFRNAGYGNLALKVYRQALEKPLISAKDRKDIIFNISNVYKDRGNGYLASGDYREALVNFKEALQHDSENANLMLNIGLIYGQALNDSANARVYLSRYLDMNPSDTRVRNYLNSLR